MLVELTAVPDAALPLAQLKDHLRLGSGFAEDNLQDDLLKGFLRAALAAVEGRTGKALFERVFRWDTPAWRNAQGAELPIAPVSAVTEVRLITRTGSETVVDPASYGLMAQTHAPCLMPAGAALPMIPAGGVARLTLTAGFGPAWDDIPADLAQAVTLLAAHYNEFRNEVDLGPGCMPFGVSALIERWRIIRLGAGGRS